jgi:hypothetical protein
VPFLLNSTLAAGLGLFVGGWTGAALAFALLASVFGLFWLAGWSRRNGAAIAALREAVLALVRPAVGLVLFSARRPRDHPGGRDPFGMASDRTSPDDPADRSRKGGPSEPSVALAALPGERVLRRATFRERPSICCSSSFSAASSSASRSPSMRRSRPFPIMLVTVMMVAIESSREPDQD